MFDIDYPGQAKFVLCDVTSHDQLEGWYPVLLPNPCDTSYSTGAWVGKNFYQPPTFF